MTELLALHPSACLGYVLVLGVLIGWLTETTIDLIASYRKPMTRLDRYVGRLHVDVRARQSPAAVDRLPPAGGSNRDAVAADLDEQSGYRTTRLTRVH